MEFFDAVSGRHSYRKAYTDQPVPRDHLRKIMEAGLAAPSGCNTQTTSLIGVDDPALLAALHGALTGGHFSPAPAAVCVLTQPIEARFGGRWNVQDYAAAIQNILLASTALGYASCWIEGDVTKNAPVQAAMSAALAVPDGYELVAYLPIGVPAAGVRGPNKKPFEERAWFNLR